MSTARNVSMNGNKAPLGPAALAATPPRTDADPSHTAGAETGFSSVLQNLADKPKDGQAQGGQPKDPGSPDTSTANPDATSAAMPPLPDPSVASLLAPWMVAPTAVASAAPLPTTPASAALSASTSLTAATSATSTATTALGTLATNANTNADTNAADAVALPPLGAPTPGQARGLKAAGPGVMGSETSATSATGADPVVPGGTATPSEGKTTALPFGAWNGRELSAQSQHAAQRHEAALVQAQNNAAASATTPTASSSVAQATNPTVALTQTFAAEALPLRERVRSSSVNESATAPSSQVGALASASATPVALPDQAVPATNASVAATPDDIAHQLKYWISSDVHNAELSLHGSGADAVQVSISLSGNQAQVVFRTDVAQTRDLLGSAMAQLDQMLRDQGMALAGGWVGNSAQQGQSNAQSQSSRGQAARQQAAQFAVGAIASGNTALRPAGGSSGVDCFV